MSGAIPPLPNTPSWRGAQLKHRDSFTFTLPLRDGGERSASRNGRFTSVEKNEPPVPTG
jgi:hypothetical protein